MVSQLHNDVNFNVLLCLYPFYSCENLGSLMSRPAAVPTASAATGPSSEGTTVVYAEESFVMSVLLDGLISLSLLLNKNAYASLVMAHCSE